MKTLEEVIKELEILEETLKSDTEKLTEDKIDQLTSQMQSIFELAQGEIDKLEIESGKQLENLQNEE
jgi:hypothetical protein